MDILAIIPARGGSKGIPRKNIRLVANKPLIAHTIEQAHQSTMITRVIVSTDDEEIADVSRRYKAEVPFMRPSEFATDTSPDIDAFRHALGWLQNQESYRPDLVVHLRATSPFRDPEIIDNAIRKMMQHPEADSLRTVSPPQHTPYKMYEIRNGWLQPLLQVENLKEPYNMARQLLPDSYWHNGYVDIIRPQVIQEAGLMSGRKIIPFITTGPHVDIDFEEDLNDAQKLMDQPSSNRKSEQAGTLPDRIELVVFDFDGVMTDNNVYLDAEGRELVKCSRGDGLGIAMLRKAGIPMMILSTETNSVVRARAEKLKLECINAVENKGDTLNQLMKQREINPENVVYLGNDLNDLPVADKVGCLIAVADSHPELIKHAAIVLKQNGGKGAVRNLCERILSRQS